jgi:ERCC4-type nuclease
MSRLKIIQDTREQRPWAFDLAFADVSVGTLKTGDYALAGDDQFAIERKSLDDFLGTIATGWPRFCRELKRMDDAEFVAQVIIVEGDFAHVCFNLDKEGQLVAPTHNHPNLTPQFITKRIAQLTMRGVSVLFAGNAEFASGIALHIF